MAGTFGNVETLMTSLRVQALAQQIISNNIANAATRGFSRQIPVLVSTGANGFTGIGGLFRPGAIGTGVALGAIARVRDEYLDLSIRHERSVRGQQQAVRDAVNALAILFPEVAATPGAGLVSAVGKFFSDWADVAAGVAGARATLVADAQSMTGLFHDADTTLADLQRVTDGRVRDSVTRINALLGQVATANTAIMQAGARGGSDNGAMDARDLALTDLAELIKIDSVKLADGSVMVVTGNARVLVRGEAVAALAVTAHPHEPAFADVMFRDPAGGPAVNITAEIGGGRIRGQVLARDGILADERLEIDELAHSLVTRVNELHRAGYAADGVTTNLDFFQVAPGMTSEEARDIAVNAALAANPLLLAASRINGNGADVDQATTLAALKGMLMNATVASAVAVNAGPGQFVDPTQRLDELVGTGLNGAGSNATNFAVAPVALPATGSLVVNGVSILWSGADSIDAIVGKINAAAAAGVRASFDFTAQKLTLISDRPLTVYDDTVGFPGSNLSAALGLQTRVDSLAPVNNGLGPLDRSLNLAAALSASGLEYRSPAAGNGVVRLEWQAPAGTTTSVVVPWSSAQGTAAILANLNLALAGAGAPLTVSFNPSTQSFVIAGTGALPGTQAAPVTPVAWVDVTGNLGLSFNLEAQPSFAQFDDALLAQMAATRDDAQGVLDQATAAVDQLELQQDAIAKVNLDEEKAHMMEYLRAYEASVRAMAAMDEMLNTLINRMAASSFQGSPTTSVLTG